MKELDVAIGLRALRLLQFVYEKSDGRLGQSLGGRRFLLLRTRGRRSGETRTAELLYVEDGPRLVVIGSRGGSDRPPGWVANLRANPTAEVQVGRRRWPVEARFAAGDERDRLWRQANQFWDYDGYQSRTSRPIPVVVLEPLEAAAG
jgi:deazaflavin-dependent oxidoreductase (nitroreductase family)